MTKWTLENIFKEIRSDFQNQISYLINNKFISEKQLLLILRNGWNLNDKMSGSNIRVLINEFCMVSAYLHSFKDDKLQYSEGVRRLGHKNTSRETINELLAHHALSRFFKNYKVEPLFSDNPDGTIRDENNYVVASVEMKSRIPELLDLMQNFTSSIDRLFAIPTDHDILINVSLKRFSSTISDTEIQNELNNIKNWYADLNATSQTMPFRTWQEFEFTKVLIDIDRSHRSTFIGIPQWLDKVSISSTHYPDFHNKTQKHFVVYLEDTFKEKISDMILNEGISRGKKNFPDEPRVIVFIGSPFAIQILSEHFESIAQKYVERKKGTMLMTVVLFISEDPTKNKVGYPQIKIGSEIAPIIDPYIILRKQ